MFTGMRGKEIDFSVAVFRLGWLTNVWTGKGDFHHSPCNPSIKTRSLSSGADLPTWAHPSPKGCRSVKAISTLAHPSPPAAQMGRAPQRTPALMRNNGPYDGSTVSSDRNSFFSHWYLSHTDPLSCRWTTKTLWVTAVMANTRDFLWRIWAIFWSSTV